MNECDSNTTRSEWWPTPMLLKKATLRFLWPGTSAIKVHCWCANERTDSGSQAKTQDLSPGMNDSRSVSCTHCKKRSSASLSWYNMALHKNGLHKFHIHTLHWQILPCVLNQYMPDVNFSTSVQSSYFDLMSHLCELCGHFSSHLPVAGLLLC